MRWLVLLVVACGGSPTPPVSAPHPEAIEAEDPPAPPAPKPEPPKGVVLSTDRPTQRQLAWLIELIGKRRGVVDEAELKDHFGPKMLKPALLPTTIEWLAKWGAEGQNAYVDSIDVDQDDYLRAFVVAGPKRWKVILNFDESSSKIEYVQFGN